MSRAFLKLGDDAYIEWSEVVDAPVSYVMTREQAVKAASEYTITEEGVSRDLATGEARIARADETGTSYTNTNSSAEEVISFNRAGPNETCITLAQMLEQYRYPMDDEA
jgi:hypothetical protein